MRNLRLTAYELRRLIRQPLTWGVLGLMLAICASTSTGLLQLFIQSQQYSSPINNYDQTAIDRYLFNPVVSSLIPCGLAIVLALLVQFEQAKRNNVRAIVHTITDPGAQYARVLAGMLAIAVLSAVINAAALYPYIASKLGSMFNWTVYLHCWGWLYLGGLILFLLLSAGIYLVFQNLFITMLFMMLLAFLLPIQIAMEFGRLLRMFEWIRTPFESLSDGSGNDLQFRILRYYRCIWLLIGVGIFMLGQILLRRNGVRIINVIPLKRRLLPMTVLAVTAMGVALMVPLEPATARPNPDLRAVMQVDEETGIEMDPELRINDYVTIIDGQLDFAFDAQKRTLRAKFIYELENEMPEKLFTLRLTIPAGMNIRRFDLDGQACTYASPCYDMLDSAFYYFQLPQGVSHQLEVEYDGIPWSDFWALTNTISPSYIDFFMLSNSLNTNSQSIPVSMTVPENLDVYVQSMWLAEAVEKEAAQQPGYVVYRYNNRANIQEHWVAGLYEEKTVQAADTQITFAYFAAKQGLMDRNAVMDGWADIVAYYAEAFGPIQYRGEQKMVIVERFWPMDTGLLYPQPPLYYSPETTIWKMNQARGVNLEEGVSLATMAELMAQYWWRNFLTDEWFYSWYATGLEQYSAYVCVKELLGEEYANEAYRIPWQREKARLMNGYYYDNDKALGILKEETAAVIVNTQQLALQRACSPLILLRAEELAGGEDELIQVLDGLRRKTYEERKTKSAIQLSDLAEALNAEITDLVEWSEEEQRYVFPR